MTRSTRRRAAAARDVAAMDESALGSLSDSISFSPIAFAASTPATNLRQRVTRKNNAAALCMDDEISQNVTPLLKKPATKRTRASRLRRGVYDSSSIGGEQGALEEIVNASAPREVMSTPPSFDPELHIVTNSSSKPHTLALDDGEDSRMTLSPVKRGAASTPFTVSPRKAVSVVATPAAATERRAAAQVQGHAYTTIVDYDSDDQPFAFSPVKPGPSRLATPGRKVSAAEASKSRAATPARATPSRVNPLLKAVTATKMIWNSATKKVEEVPVEVQVPIAEAAAVEEVYHQHQEPPVEVGVEVEIEPAAGKRRRRKKDRAVSVVDKEAEPRVRGEEAPMAVQKTESPLKSTSPPALPRKVDIEAEAEAEEQQAESENAGDHDSHGETRSATEEDGFAFAVPEMPPLQTSPRRPPRRSGRRAFALPLERKRPLVSESPLPKLTRAVSGIQPLQKLEVLAVPEEYLYDPEEEARQAARVDAQARRKQARLAMMHKFTPTVPVSPKLGVTHAGKRKSSGNGATRSPAVVNEMLGELHDSPQAAAASAALPARTARDRPVRRASGRRASPLLQMSSPLVQDTSRSKKRKATDDLGEGTAGIHSPAKRVKMPMPRSRLSLIAGPARRSLAPVTSRQIRAESAVKAPRLPDVYKPKPTVPSFEFTSETLFKSRADKREEKRLREEADAAKRHTLPAQLGAVPRTLYSPERPVHRGAVGVLGQPTPDRDARAGGDAVWQSPTIPAPFKFETAARADQHRHHEEVRAVEDAAVAIVTAARKSTGEVRGSKVHVAVLEQAPFVPKPSSHATTVARSPERGLEGRLELRRQFDAVAQHHAERTLERKKRREEELALERERRTSERQSMRVKGLDTVLAWGMGTQARSSLGAIADESVNMETVHGGGSTGNKRRKAAWID